MMHFCWKFLVPVGLVFVVAAAVERTLLLENGWDASIALPVFGLINAALTAAAVVVWAKLSGTESQKLPSRAIMARGRFGGLRAAQAIRFEELNPEPVAGGGD